MGGIHKTSGHGGTLFHRVNPDTVNKMPWKLRFDEKFSLFGFAARLPLSRVNRLPVDFI